MLVWIGIRSSPHFDNVWVLYHRKESRFNRKVNNTSDETVRVGLNLLTELFDGIPGILSLALRDDDSRISDVVWCGELSVGKNKCDYADPTYTHGK